MTKPLVLIADDDLVFIDLMKNVISSKGYRVLTASGVDACMRLLAEHRVDILFQDLCFPHLNDGFEILEHVHEYHPETQVIMISGEGNIPDAVCALKSGASDFIEKPIPAEHIMAKITAMERKLDLEHKNRELAIKAIGMIGQSRAMQAIYDSILKAAQYDTPVLILGETGTGKELVGRAIHKLSAVSDKNLITVNCGAIPNELMEAELFGYEKGSFTHAIRARKGYFEMADGSSIFLNEIGELPFAMQAKLLRVLREGEIQKIGGQPLHIRTRVICDTNRDLPEMIKIQEFREDLYFRINTFIIELPPLRERKEDIPALAEHFMNSFCTAHEILPKPVSLQALMWLSTQEFKGNVAELKSTIERAIINAKNDHITELDLQHRQPQKDDSSCANPRSLRCAVEEFEKAYIENALAANSGNISQTAKILDYDRSNLLKRMKKLGIQE